MENEVNFNKALGQINSYIEGKKIRYGLSDCDVAAILDIIMENYWGSCKSVSTKKGEKIGK